MDKDRLERINPLNFPPLGGRARLSEPLRFELRLPPDPVTTASGLQHQVITAGDGKKPAADDAVKVHYRGTLLDGTEFDSSYHRNEPVSFRVNEVIPGLTEALQLMPVGSKWKLWIPSELAYGAGGAGDKIPPNATLIFEVELLSIESD
jgi:FKBP-type peptidyl-prolyl cis-trans isomerase